MTVPTKPARPKAEANTYNLPRGEDLRRALAKAFRVQRTAVLHYVRTGRKSAGGLAVKAGDDAPGPPYAMPPLDDFGLGALAFAERMTPLITATWEAAAGKFASRIGLDPNEWAVVDRHAAQTIQDAALAFSASTNATTSLALDEALRRTREELHEGVVTTGESVDKLTARINRIFDQAETWRARRIAQTETSRAVHAAQERTAIDSGVVRGWEWLLSSDACPLCHTVARRAPAVRLGQPFAVVSADPNYGTVKFPPLHPHCNCTVVPVLDVDDQPRWAETLHQPIPGPEDGAPEPKPDPYVPPPLPRRDPKRPTPAEPIGDYLPTDEEIAKPKPKPKKPKAPPKLKKPKTPPFPESLEGLETVRKLGGSTGALLVKDPTTGRLFVLKKGGSGPHVASEAAADALYRAAGLDVPEARLYMDARGGVTKLAEYIEGKTLGQVRKEADAAVYGAAIEKLRKGFAVDALLGNWAVVGAGYDNILVTDDGRVVRIDNGGALSYRAQGAKKSKSQWSGSVDELESMRNPKSGSTASQIFQGIDDAHVKTQIKGVLRAKARILDAARKEEHEILAARFDSLAAFLSPKPKPKPVKVGNWKPTPAERFVKISPEDTPAWGKTHYNQWAKELSDDEKRGVRMYTGSDYREVNDYLRGMSTVEPTAMVKVPALDAALEKHPAPEDVVVYRGFGLAKYLKSPDAIPGVVNRSDFQPGMDIVDKGYTSTSPNIDKAWSGEKLEIRVRKGTPGAYVDAVSSVKGEQEFLLARKVDRLRIIEVLPDRIVVEALITSELKPVAKPRAKPKPKPKPKPASEESIGS